MREVIIFTIYAVAVVALAAIFTFIERRFPKVRMPYVYQEKLWLNMLIKVIYVTIICIITRKLFP